MTTSKYPVLNSKLFIRKNYSYEYTIAANEGLTIYTDDLQVSIPDGYLPFAYRQITTGHGSVLLRGYLATFATTATPQNMILLTNISGSSATATLNVQIVFVKSSWFFTD